MKALALAAAALAAVAARADAQALRAARPDVTWADAAATGDFDGDGVADEAYVGKLPDKVAVGVVLSSAKAPQILVFAVDDQAHAAVCDDDVTLTAELLDYDPGQVQGGLEGFKLCGTCKGLKLDDGECDPIHLYWNTVQRRLGWWRL